MKKYILVLLSLLVCMSSINYAAAKTTANSELTSAIKMYKSQNYSGCYALLNRIVEKDPSNAVAYYYLAMASVQIGKQSEAISNYEKVISLSPNNQLGIYATKGKTCIETPEKCHETSQESSLDRFVQGKFGSGFSEKAKEEYEIQKINNMMREMNRNQDIAPQKFRDYKDFSSSALPTNDEIVNALKVLQQAGFNNIVGNGYNNYSQELSWLTGSQNDNAMLSILAGQNSNSSNSSLSPQVIQALITSQMTAGF